MRIAQTVQFKREKHQRGCKVGDFFLHIGHEFCPFAIGCHLVIPQARKGHNPTGNGGNAFIAFNTAQHFGRR